MCAYDSVTLIKHVPFQNTGRDRSAKMHSLVKEMGALSQNEHHEEETGRGGHRRAGNFDEATPGRRSSKRLSEKRTGTTNSSELHDSGTESDEEELEQIIQSNSRL